MPICICQMKLWVSASPPCFISLSLLLLLLFLLFLFLLLLLSLFLSFLCFLYLTLRESMRTKMSSFVWSWLTQMDTSRGAVSGVASVTANGGASANSVLS